MATSSITKNFIISGEKQVEKFANAIESSANSDSSTIRVAVTQLRGSTDIKKFMAKRNKSSV